MHRSTLIVAALLAACATGPKTKSGRPEVVVQLDAKTAKAQLADHFMARGSNIEASDDLGFTISQPFDEFGRAMFGRGTHRVRFGFLERDGHTMIRATIYHLSSFGDSELSGGKAGAELQATLERLFAQDLAAGMPQG